MSASVPSQSASTFQRRGLSLRWRLIVLIVAIALPVFVIIALAMHTVAQNLLIEYANTQIATSNATLKSTVDTWIDLNSKALKELAMLPGMNNMDAAQQKPYLQAMTAAYPDMYLVSTTNLTGTNVARSDDEAAANYGDRAWFIAARNGNPIAFQTLIGKTTGRPAMVAATPISRSGEIVGVAMFSIDLTKVLQDVRAARIGKTGYAYVIDDKNLAVAHPDPVLNDYQLHDLSADPAVQALRQNGPGAAIITDAQGRRWHAYLDVLPNGWGIIAQEPEAELLIPLRDFQAITLVVFSIGLLLLIALSWFAVGRALRPIRTLTDVATAVAGGDLNQTAPITRYDEVGVLSAAFNAMTARLREFINSLEQRINARTEQLRASAEVGRAAVSILDTNQLLREIVNLITDRFGFYYTAVFLADNTNKWAVLREATGEAGRTLKEHHHQLEIGGNSMVGSVMKTRKARIALDVGDEAVRFANPLLPGTRSEIALPLVVGSRAIGALDVQSTEMAAFDEASAAVLQSMADQIAIALSNTMQFQQAQLGLQRTRQLYEASMAVSNAEDAHGTLHELMTKAVLDADAALILTYGPRDETGQVAYYEVAAGWSRSTSDLVWQEGMRLAPDQVPPVPASASEPFVIRDVEDAETPPAVRNMPRALHMRALLGYALVAGSQPIGLLIITYREPRLFMANEIQPLQALSGQVAVTLRNQQLVREAAASAKQLDEINRRLTGQTWSNYARTSGGALLKEDVGPAAYALGETDATMLTAPIVIHGAEVGQLRLEDAASDREWTPGELALVQAVAGEVSIALENARLIEETERRAQRERLVAEVSRRMFTANDIETIVQIAGEELGRALAVNRAAIKLDPRLFTGPSTEAPHGNGHAVDQPASGGTDE